MNDNFKKEIEKKLEYLGTLPLDNPRVNGHIFALQLALANDFDYEKKLEYLTSLKSESEYVRGQLEELYWLMILSKAQEQSFGKKNI